MSIISNLKRAISQKVVKDPILRWSLVFPIFLSLFPLIFRDETIIVWFLGANYVAIFAMALDFLLTSGYLSFGQQVFFAVSAYAVGMAYLYIGVPTGAGIILGILAALAFSLPVGIACLKWRGPYLILATSILPGFFSAIIGAAKDWTGGYQELPGYLFPGRYIPPIIETTDWFLNTVIAYYISLALMIITAITLIALTYSKFGLIISAIRENEIAAEACGINTTKYKTICFCISAIFAALAGGFYAGNAASTIALGPTTAGARMMNAFFGILVGGMWSIVGAIGGVYVLTTIQYLTNELQYVWSYAPYFGSIIVYSVMVLIFYFMPAGLIRTMYWRLRYKLSSNKRG
jgi:branched-chain amino acid transport system permease protein